MQDGLVPGSETRSPWIDVLRGLAILSVVLLHIDIRIPFAQNEWGALLSREVTRVVFRSGYYGVRVFFVISGFLITSTILRRAVGDSSLDVKAFYKRRFARIAPCLLGLLTILAALHLAGVPGFVVTKTSLPHALFAALTFYLNQLEIVVGYLPAPWDVLWSLSVEEVFYVAFPLLLYFVRFRPLLGILALALMLCGPLARTTWAVNDLDSDYSYLSGFDGIALGCVAAFASRSVSGLSRMRALSRWVGLALMLLIVVFRSASGWLQLGRLGLDVTVLAIGVALFLFGMAARDPLKPSFALRLLAPLRWLGRQSYEVYLTHSFLMVWGAQWFRETGSPKAMIPVWHFGLLVGSALFGAIVARGFSEPMNVRLRRRLGV